MHGSIPAFNPSVHGLRMINATNVRQNTLDNFAAANTVLQNTSEGPSAANSYFQNGQDYWGNHKLVIPKTAPEITRPDLILSDAVLKFVLNRTADWDGNNRDRQRMEIRGYNNLNATGGGGTNPLTQGTHGAIITYYWKMYLPPTVVDPPPAGFFHIFQLKGGPSTVPESQAPMATLTITRDRIRFRYTTIGANMDNTFYIAETEIENVAGRWISMEVTAHYQDNGYIYCKMICLERDIVLMEAYSRADMWRRPESNASGTWVETNLPPVPQQSVRPKWGLYRAVNDNSGPMTMYWTDMVMIRRNIENYRFPDGYAPRNAPPDYWFDLTSWAWNQPANTARYTGSRASHNHSTARINNLFFDFNNRTNAGFATTYDFPNMLNDGVNPGRLPLWVAVDLGAERPINEIEIIFNSVNDYRRLDSLYVAYTNDFAAYDALVNKTSGTGVFTMGSTLTTLDPLGIHTETERYYIGDNPYLFADSWTQFVRIPRLSEHNVPGVRTNITLRNIFNSARTLEGMIPGKDSFEARYVIMYADVWPYTNESRNPALRPVFAPPADIRIRSFHMRNNPEVGLEE
jgi:hypothetical protein